MPQVHEVMHTSNDIPADYLEVVNKYAPGKEICQGIKFDFSWLLHYGQPQLWAVLSLHNVEKQAAFLAKLKNNFTYEEYKLALIETLVENP